MKLPPVEVSWTDDDGEVRGFRLSQPSLTADPQKRAEIHLTISLLYAYSDVMTELLKLAAPATARAIAAEERMLAEDAR